MSKDDVLKIHNGEVFPLAGIQPETIGDFRYKVLQSVADGGRIAALFGQPKGDSLVNITAVIAHDAQATMDVFTASVEREYESLTPLCLQSHWFEREIFEQCGLMPVGHPWLKPIRFQRRINAPAPDSETQAMPQPVACGVADFFHMDGDEIHEVAVGPVHAGIIEPGHFRFQCHGEKVYHLEISLGYQHRGVERAMISGPNRRSIHYMETLAGDTSIAHAIAYCRAVEALSKTHVSARAQVIRGIVLELERIANHIGDLGALAGDIGYLPTMSYCGRIRGDVLNMTALICGNRFGRNLIRSGGVTFDLDGGIIKELKRRVGIAFKDAKVAIELLWESPSVTARFDQTGVLTPEICNRIGLVGVAARACGVPRDVRQDFPSGIYRFVQIPVSTWHTGDVFARAYVRWLEIQRSLAFVDEQLDSLPEGAIRESIGPLQPDSAIVTLAEGWRGEICHVAKTDSQGHWEHYKIVDPSFHNWFGLALALKNQQIADFPLCNKSFNLSYCGHDL
jgi:Ni,Fe-hydrogenase III large subunit